MKQINVNTSRNYTVTVGNNLLRHVSKLICDASNVCVVCDNNVWTLYGKNLREHLCGNGALVGYYVFPAGERSKNAETYLDLLNFLSVNGYTRSDCIIALGGGVVGDLAGFASATYLRGIPYIQMPTTLLAMVDSSVGGKTGIDLPSGKNLCGAFYQPDAVLCDTDALNTLPEDIFRDGCAEIIKYAVLFDPELFAILEQDGLRFDREWVIARCIEHKRNCVEQDELDRGQRKLLNLGHTIGHAIEKCSDYYVSHGKAVAIGMAMASRAAKCPDAGRIVALLEKFGLPTATDIPASALYRAALSDKKRSGDTVDLIIPMTIGNCAVVSTPVEDLNTFIEEGMKTDITIQPGLLNGTIDAIPSKSMAHRLLICAALDSEPTELVCPQTSEDIEATALALRKLCHYVGRTDYGYEIRPYQYDGDGVPPSLRINCHESGSTLRFLLPVVGALGIATIFELEGRLPNRPLSPLWEEMERMGCSLSRPAASLVQCTGKLRPGAYRMDGSVSSQFISGLMMALPLIEGETSLEITGNVESKPYIEMTRQAIGLFKANRPKRIEVEGDWSNAAFWLAANALGSTVTVTGLQDSSPQGDRAITELLPLLNGKATISAADIPDLVPVLAVVAAAKQGAVFTDIRRLRLKESDRVASIITMLESLGGKAEATENTLTVFGTGLTGGAVDSFGDHRIAMAAAIAATVCKEPVTILGAECVKKSYPAFWEDYSRLGGNYGEYLR